MFGFDVHEVKAEICRGRRLRCRYCGIFGACVGCTKKTCQYSFHLPCLYDSKGFVCFKKSFEAFCYKHRPKQVIVLIFLILHFVFSIFWFHFSLFKELVSRLRAFKDHPPVCCVCLFSVVPDDNNEPNTLKNELKLPYNGKALRSKELATISNHALCPKRASLRKHHGKRWLTFLIFFLDTIGLSVFSVFHY